MIEPLQIVWMAFVFCLFVALLVLLEIRRINDRRENEEMFGTQAFDEKVAELGFSDKEKRTLDKIIRTSSFENKDAIINSSGLFEQAVTAFYDVRDVFDVRDETLAAVEALRLKMNFTASNRLSEIYSTRQFNVGDRIDLIPENGTLIKRSDIVWRSEKEWAISYDGSEGPASSFVGQNLQQEKKPPNGCPESKTRGKNTNGFTAKKIHISQQILELFAAMLASGKLLIKERIKENENSENA